MEQLEHNPPCPLPFCEFLRIQADINQWEQQFIPCEAVILKFYNSKRRLMRSMISTDAIYFSNHLSPYFRTELEYTIAINRILAMLKQTGTQCLYSYIEVHEANPPHDFIIRHYVRGGILSPLWSTSPIDQDVLLRERQIATKPTIDWRGVIGIGRKNKNVTLHEFVEKYKLTP